MSKATTIGDFMEWARRDGWTLRNIDVLHRCDGYDNENGDSVPGWAGVLATSCFFVSDEQIQKELPEKTAEEWDEYGR